MMGRQEMEVVDNALMDFLAQNAFHAIPHVPHVTMAKRVYHAWTIVFLVCFATKHAMKHAQHVKWEQKVRRKCFISVSCSPLFVVLFVIVVLIGDRKCDLCFMSRIELFS